MKKTFFLMLTPLVVPFLFSVAQAQETKIPHLDLEMTGQEYERLWQHVDLPQMRSFLEDSGLQDALALGKRNLDWLNVLNEKREKKISFTSKETQRGIPIDSPSRYNEQIILEKLSSLTKEIPEPLRNILLNPSAPLPEELPIDLDVYIEWGRKVDNLYQLTNRWFLLRPYLSALARLRYKDVRGYYYTKKDPNLVRDLSNFDDLSQERRQQIKGWFLGLCLNNRIEEAACSSQFENSRRKKSLVALYGKLKAESERIWNVFFHIPTTNADSKWENDKNMRVHFTLPNSEDRRSFLSVNIEDEWRWADWKLALDFGNSGVEVIWTPNTTPHVPGLGASTIYMDENQPLTEYDAQWTIRHEFGHVLGFPDCYIEFYDKDAGEIINYQIDIDNLMCSRKGKLQEKHFLELKKAYGK